MNGFLSCDWGGTGFRLRRVGEDDRVMDEYSDDSGASAVAATADNPDARAAAFASGLADGIAQISAHGDTAGLPVVVSGMATSAHGWMDLPYASVPAGVDGRDFVTAETVMSDDDDPRRRVVLVSGLRTDTDIMRGEESELAGLFSLPDFAARADDSIVVMPGTHSKHVRVHENRIVDFVTFMTGELFALLERRSVLARSLDDTSADDASSDDDFAEGVRHGADVGLAEALFRVRTRRILDDRNGAANRAFLSGVCIGDELSRLARDGDDTPLLVCGAPPLCEAYARAADALRMADRTTAVPPDTSARLAVLGHAVVLESLGID